MRSVRTGQGNTSSKMAPWPEPETEPKAPDKTAATADKPCDAAVASMKNERDATDASAACKPVSVALCRCYCMPLPLALP